MDTVKFKLVTTGSCLAHESTLGGAFSQRALSPLEGVRISGLHDHEVERSILWSEMPTEMTLEISS